jgi:hypothetical protein
MSAAAPKPTPCPMTVRTIRRDVTFRHPFFLKGADGMQPPGTYTVETDEEQIPGLSFLAYRRIATTIVLSVRYENMLARQVATIDPADLETALARDLHMEDASASEADRKIMRSKVDTNGGHITGNKASMEA